MTQLDAIDLEYERRFKLKAMKNTRKKLHINQIKARSYLSEDEDSIITVKGQGVKDSISHKKGLQHNKKT